MSIKSYISIGIASVATLVGAGAAQAAALQGRVGLNPPSPVPGGPDIGVVLTGTGNLIPGTNLPETDFDFVPPAGGGTGPIVEINANPLPTGEDDFSPFVGSTGTIQDVTAAQLNDVLSGASDITDLIVIPGAFSVTATDISVPVYTETTNILTGEPSTTVSLGVSADFFNLSDGSGDVSQGVGIFSIDFAGLTIAETQDLYDDAGEVSPEFNPTTWSSNWVVTAQPEVVPEASNLLGLIVIGLGGAAMFARKK